MNRSIKLSIAVTALVCTLSCNKQLDLPSDGRISMKEIFSDDNRTRGYLNSCYGYLPALSIDRASFTDEAQDADDNLADSRFSNWYAGGLNASNYASISTDGSPWGRLYEGIRKCNVFIENIKTANIVASEAIKDGWTAQAYALRALYYLQLIKRYGAVPVFDKPLALDHNFAADKRASFSEVVAFIISDCDKALSYPDTREGFSWAVYENQFGIMTRAVAYAVKSQAVTYAASPLWSDGKYSWADATAINAEALAQCLAHDYKLFNEAPAANIAQNAYALYHFVTSNDQRSRDKETIYQGGSQLQIWRDAGLPSNTGMVKAGPSPSQELVDSYEMANGEMPVTGYADAEKLMPIINPASGYDPTNPYAGRDPRFYASIYYNGAARRLNTPSNPLVETFVGGREQISSTLRTNTRTGYYLRKFNNYQSGQNNNADGAIRLFRLAELYLNFAESAYQSDGPDGVVSAGGLNMSARDAVNAVRARVNMPSLPAGLSKEAFEKRYRNERRVELAFEEHRFFDVRRWKILDQTDKAVTGMRITRSGSVWSYERFKMSRNAWSDKYLMYPLDRTEVEKMSNQTGVNWQNPGWND